MECGGRQPAARSAPGGSSAELSPSAHQPCLLDGETIRAALDSTLDRFGQNDLAQQFLQCIAAKEPDLFFAAAMDRLRAASAPGQGKLSLRLLDLPEFLLQLVSPERLSRQELVEVCQQLMQHEPLLDVKLARLLPGRQAAAQALDSATAVRLMDVLDTISPGPRLNMIIGHLTQHADRRIASKAALLIGRRLHSPAWVGAHLDSPDPRVRANVVEALWGERTALALKTFRACLRDDNNRVVGNALFGLHLAEDREAGPRSQQLLHDPRTEFRQTAIWVIEKTRDPRSITWLEAAQADDHPDVRRAAQKALRNLTPDPPRPV